MNENVEFTAYGVVRQGNARRQAHIVAIFSTYTEAEKANSYFNTTPSYAYKVEEINIFKKHIQP